MTGLFLFRSRARCARRTKRGAILFMAVGAIAVLSILVIGTTSSILQALRLAKFVRDANISVFEAASLIDAVKVIQAADKTPYDLTLHELRPRTVVLGGDVAEITFTDEQGKINIGSAGSDVLGRMPGFSGRLDLIDAITGKTFYLKQELLLIEEVTGDIYGAISPIVTTYGTGAVNINTASAEVMAALGMEDDLAGKVVRYRAGDDGAEGSQDDKAFSFPAEIVPLLERQGLAADQRILLEGLVSSGKLGTDSDYITVNIDIRKGGTDASKAQKVNRSFSIILNLATGMIVQWQEV